MIVNPLDSPDHKKKKKKKKKKKMVVKISSYEECRRKRLEANKKKIEELNLQKRSQALSNIPSARPKPSPMKRVKPRTIEEEMAVVRRSNRVANKPIPAYKEVVLESLQITRRNSKPRDPVNPVIPSDDSREEAIRRAENLLSGLEPQHPSFVKSMLPSQVSGGYWLGLPREFCRRHLPKSDKVIILRDEDGVRYDTNYLARSSGLSGGWKGFAVAHDLVYGDAMVFQLVKPTTFEVYVLRLNDSD